jgi:hypothetical protein
MMQITKRERFLAVGLTGVVAFLALYAWAIRPARDRIHTLERVIPEKQAQLRDLQTKSTQYLSLRNEFAQAKTRLASQDLDFELLPFLETTIERHQLAKHVAKMEPDTLRPQAENAEVVVTIELHEISLKQLVDFLSDVETSESVVHIGSLHISKNPKSDTLLDSTVGVCSPKFGPPAVATQSRSSTSIP